MSKTDVSVLTAPVVHQQRRPSQRELERELVRADNAGRVTDHNSTATAPTRRAPDDRSVVSEASTASAFEVQRQGHLGVVEKFHAIPVAPVHDKNGAGAPARCEQARRGPSRARLGRLGRLQARSRPSRRRRRRPSTRPVRTTRSPSSRRRPPPRSSSRLHHRLESRSRRRRQNRSRRRRPQKCRTSSATPPRRPRRLPRNRTFLGMRSPSPQPPRTSSPRARRAPAAP